MALPSTGTRGPPVPVLASGGGSARYCAYCMPPADARESVRRRSVRGVRGGGAARRENVRRGVRRRRAPGGQGSLTPTESVLPAA
eukprot:scaffold4116_cov338-Prasinococcus_capsulatus_cf.AAC.8